MEKRKLIIFTAVYVILTASVIFLSYKLQEKKTETEFIYEQQAEITDEKRYSVDEIPDDISYTMKLCGDEIIISDSVGNTVYKTGKVDVSRFSENDICKLRQDGILLSCRTDVIETLNYMES
ncbi:MAG: hypothetical protein J5844_01690 [Clostridia bacterium]|nr:hypothetical protein [Clostridia bacterium]